MKMISMFSSLVDKNKKAIVRLDFHVSRDYFQRLIDSCKSVFGGDGKALDIVCKSSSKIACTPELLAQSMEEQAEEFGKFVTKFILRNSPQDEFSQYAFVNFSTRKCSEAATVSFVSYDQN